MAGPVLVTGAAGFIGSRVCAALRRQGVRVVALDNLSVGLPLPKSDELTVAIAGDIRDRALLAEIFAEGRPSAVLHLAAVHHIPTCEREPTLAFDVNVMGTQYLLEAIEKSENCLGLAMASSGAVYDFSEGPLNETASPLRARDVYATTKLTNEYQLETWAGRHGRRAHVGRLFNTIGTNDPNAHLIPDVLRQVDVATQKHVRIRLGNAKPRRDYIFVEDAAAGFVNILSGLDLGGDFEAFNICRGEEFSVVELVEAIGALLNREIVIETDPTRFRKVDRLSQLGDASKMAKWFDWRAQVPFEEALARILRANGYQVTEAKNFLPCEEDRLAHRVGS